MIIFIISIALLVAFLPIPIILLLLHGAINVWRKLGHATYRLAVAVWLIIGIVVIMLRDFLLMYAITFPFLLRVGSAAMVIGGFFLCMRAQQHLTLQRLIGMPEIVLRMRQKLIVTGMYSRIRHPRYMGYFLILEGWFLISGYIIFPLIALALLLVIPLEERELAQRFGLAYCSYRENVPAFFPRLKWSRNKQ